MAASAAVASRRGRRPGEGRVWRPVERAPVPAEPGREVTIALLQAARRARGRVTTGDDRLETDVYADKRYLYRQAHAERSGRFARSTDQLVAGLAPIMRWGAVPRRGTRERTRFFRRHRASVQRWLAWLRDAGLIELEAEIDNQGYWWRIVITLPSAPAPAPEQRHAARRRMRGWARRERLRQARRQPPRRSLQAIRRSSQIPHAETRARLARGRALASHEARRRVAVEQTIAAGQRRRQSHHEDLRHPYGAPPTSALSQVSSKPLLESETCEVATPPSRQPAPTTQSAPPLTAGTGARTREAPSAHHSTPPAPQKDCTEEIGSGPVPGSPDFDALVEARIAAREQGTRWRRREAGRQAVARAAEVASWPVGRPCPLGRLREAWVVYRHGATIAGDTASGWAGSRRPGQERLAARAIALYEAFADQRPPGWPAGGAAALTALAAQQRAASLAGDIARLLILAKDMRAAALERDAERLAAMRRRAERRNAPQPPGRFEFRTGEAPRYESDAQLRDRLRDDLLLAGEHPGAYPNLAFAEERVRRLHGAAAELGVTPAPRYGWENADRQRRRREEEAAASLRRDAEPYGISLDGMADRAKRYRRELAHGRWDLPERWTAAVSQR